MGQIDILLKQYEVFSLHKLHFGGLFWKILGVFISLCVFSVGLIQVAKPEYIPATLLFSGFLTILISYVCHRLRQNEDSYENLMCKIESELSKHVEFDVGKIPLSKKYGSRSFVTVIFGAIGLLSFMAGIYMLLKA